MEWLVWMVAVAILGLAAVAASGRLGEFPATVTDTPQPHVPSGTLSGSDLRALRFAVVPRGYSMQQVDELLDRVSRQLDHEPLESTPPSTAAVHAVPNRQWDPPARSWEESEVVEPSAEVEPQPPLHDGAEAPPARAEEPPSAPSWRAAEVVYATTDVEPTGIFVDELEPAPRPEPAADAPRAAEPEAVTSAERAAVTEPEAMAEPEPGTGSELTSRSEAEADAEPEVNLEPAGMVESEPGREAEPAAAAAPEPGPVTAPEMAASDANQPALAVPKSRRESKARAKPASVAPEPVSPTGEPIPADGPELPVDELEAEIANIGDGQAVVADYGAALDDLVSKYSFRKVEHWYELPGFDIPAPTDLGAPKEAEEAEPRQDSTSDDI